MTLQKWLQYRQSHQSISGWWFGTFFIFPFSWEFHHPNWRSHIFQRGRYTTNQIITSSIFRWMSSCKQLAPHTLSGRNRGPKVSPNWAARIKSNDPKRKGNPNLQIIQILGMMMYNEFHIFTRFPILVSVWDANFLEVWFPQHFQAITIKCFRIWQSSDPRHKCNDIGIVRGYPDARTAQRRLRMSILSHQAAGCSDDQRLYNHPQWFTIFMGAIYHQLIWVVTFTLMQLLIPILIDYSGCRNSSWFVVASVNSNIFHYQPRVILLPSCLEIIMTHLGHVGSLQLWLAMTYYDCGQAIVHWNCPKDPLIKHGLLENPPCICIV